jgi:hypothetical protein
VRAEPRRQDASVPAACPHRLGAETVDQDHYCPLDLRETHAVGLSLNGLERTRQDIGKAHGRAVRDR